MKDVTNQPTNQPLADHQFELTVFPDNLARRKTVMVTTLPDLAAHIQATSARVKDQLPLLKVAHFGDIPSTKRCLRTDANMGQITGIEVEHDSGQISFKSAIKILKAAGLRCLIYTTPSHRPVERERWRVLLPLSRGTPNSERERLVELVNALFGGKLAGESFRLSQAFYFGQVDGTQLHVVVLDGVFVDLAGLTERIGPAPVVSKPKAGTISGMSHDLADLRREAEKYLTRKGRWDGGWYHFMLSYTASLVARQFSEAEIRHECGPCCDLGEDDPELTEFIDSALRKFGPRSAPAGLRAALDVQGQPPAPPAWDHTDKGAIRLSMRNAARAMEGLGLKFTHDTFHNKMWIGSEGGCADYIGELNDMRLRALRWAICEGFQIDFGEKHVREAAVTLAEAHRFDPVADMLSEAEAGWDGVARIDRMAVDHFNADDTALNRAFVRKLMIAAVRRVRQPGCKFDQILVMESAEGWNKSSCWRLLAGEGNFSDESIMGRETRLVQEHLADIWILECAELAGITRREIEMVTTFASRQEDRARPAYGHFLITQPRHSILVGTTNADNWLPKQTGNRRFWPLRVLAPIDLAKLRRDRLQLWGEAARLETAGESLTLDRALWAEAGIEQEERRIVDPWEDVLVKLKPIANASLGMVGLFGLSIVHEMNNFEFVASTDIFEHALPRVTLDSNSGRRLSSVMRQIGWTRYVARVGETQLRGYRREPKKRNKPRIVTHRDTSSDT